ncbi:MAG: WYL domain-containing protein [Candidatus Marinimicrobia bacterium]|jgi:predicted DNA-binding transcriptional regulator YafY|nr:WYL domain-containing protein [Candidatus Neomarinimicrobiota bacterium]
MEKTTLLECTMMNATLRRIETLRLVPRAPHWITVTEIVERLDALDYPVTLRTIQRDLMEMASLFPLDYELKGRLYRWRWLESAEVLDLPGMSPQTALSFFLAEQYLFEMMPPHVTSSLEPHFNRARNVLSQRKSKRFGGWLDKVRVLPETQNLLPPPVNQSAADTIYASLLEDSQITAEYKKRGNDTPKHYKVIHPLGLVFRQRVIYLVASVGGYDTPIQFALHRFVSAKMIHKAIRIPKGFDLDHYIQSGSFAYLLGDSFQIELLFAANRGAHLKETPLSLDQIIEVLDDGRIRVKATVKNSNQLRWWILGFGDEVEVVSPCSFRDEFTALLKRMLGNYN